jgi:hypothetical protein
MHPLPSQVSKSEAQFTKPTAAAPHPLRVIQLPAATTPPMRGHDTT